MQNVSNGVRDIVRALQLQVKGTLSEQFRGMYLFGSLALGDFHPEASDIDFIVTTATPLSPEATDALEKVHEGLKVSHPEWGSKLEGGYVPESALRRYDPTGGPYPCTNEGDFYLAKLGSEWICNLAILRERGIIIDGPAPGSFIEPVAPDDIRQAARGFLSESGEYMRGRLTTPGYQTYAVLTMCRVLYSITTGAVTSKVRAAQWAKTRMDPQWQPLIDAAVATRVTGDLDNVTEVDRFIRTVTAMDLG